jgi:hypothetical protein
MEVKNSWEKGLNSDFSKTKTPNNTYLDALNIRVVTDEGNSTLAIENTKGTLYRFSTGIVRPTYKLDFRQSTGTVTFNINGNTVTINNVELKNTEQIAFEINDFLTTNNINAKAFYNSKWVVVYTYENGIVLNAAVGFTLQQRNSNFNSAIIGWTHFEDKIVLLCGNNNVTTDEPENQPPPISINAAYGAIYILKINDSTNQIESLDGLPAVTPAGFLIQNRTLKYVGLLNLSRFYDVYKNLVVRYENSKILRVIWTDFYNSLRTINILNPQVEATPEELIDYLPTHERQQPIIDEIIDGGTLPSAKYYFFYQLKSFSGAESSVSPVSNGIVLSAGPMANFTNFNAVSPGTNSQKSIRIYVPNVDTNYDIIRFGYLVYQVANIPEAFWFDEKAISQALEQDGRISAVLNGNENTQSQEIPLEDITQISNVNRPPEVFKTIATVKNRLAAANAKTKFFDVDFDSRAYRFNNSNIAHLYNSTNSYGSPSVNINYTSGVVTINGSDQTGSLYQQLLQIPDSFDLINPYNNEDPSDPLNNGNWVNNSQFNLNPAIPLTLGGYGPNISYRTFTHSDNVVTETFSTTAEASTITPRVLGDLDTILINGVDYKVGGSFTSMKSPYIKSLYTGYARGEVYRFGIVFFDLKGYPTPVHWIGDIKFPQFNEVNLGIGVEYDQAVQIGIEFTLDTTTPQFQAIKDKVSGWSYVRMQRFESDKTKLGTGIMNSLWFTSNRYINALENTIPSGYTSVNNYWNLDWPNSHFGIDNRFLQGDYIKIFGQGVRSNAPSPFVTPNLIDNDRKVHSFRQVSYLNLNTTDRRPILNNDRLRVDRSYNSNVITNLFGSPDNYYNMATTSAADALNEDFQAMGNLTDIVNIASIAVPSNFNKYYFSYERYNPNQYGGRTRSARYNNKYIPISYRYYNPDLGFTIVNDICFNGDTTVVLYDHQKLDKNDTPATGFGGVNPRLGYAQYFWAECHNFNPELRILKDGQHASTRNELNIIYNENVNVVNRAYDNDNTYSIYLSLPLNPNLELIEPNTIYITENKLDGERTDSWRFFRVNNALSVKGNLGAIQRLITFRDKLFFFQQNGFGIAAVEERVLVNEGDGSETQLGTGGVLSRYDYITEEIGASHMWAIESSGNSIYFYNAYINKFFRFTGEGVSPLSDISGLSGYFRNLNPAIKTIDKILLDGSLHMSYDHEYNTLYFTCNIPENEFTISYNELLRAFESFHSFHPYFYLNTKRKLISLTEDENSIIDDVYLHNSNIRNVYYEQYHPSKIKFRVNESGIAEMSKIFDNFAFVTELYQGGNNLNQTFDHIQCTNDYQDTGFLPVQPRIRQFIRDWRMAVPFDNTNPTLRIKPRMVDKYMDVELTYDKIDPTVDRKFLLHDVKTTYSLRGQILPQSMKR